MNVKGRNDWTSTIPQGRNSFFYPRRRRSFVFTDAFPSLQKFFSTGKLRAAYAEVGRDAPPYSYATSLEAKTTSFGGYGYGFTGPNPTLEPEFAKDYEFGTELSWLEQSPRRRCDGLSQAHRESDRPEHPRELRHGVHPVQPERRDDARIRVSSSLSAARRSTAATSRGTSAQLHRARGKTLSLPNALPESYISDTWLYGNVRNGTEPGLSTMSLTGFSTARTRTASCSSIPRRACRSAPRTFIDARLRSPAELHARPRQQLQVQARSASAPVRHPEGRRRLQRDRALSDDSRARHEHARPQYAARHSGCDARRQGEQRPTRRRITSS